MQLKPQQDKQQQPDRQRPEVGDAGAGRGLVSAPLLLCCCGSRIPVKRNKREPHALLHTRLCPLVSAHDSWQHLCALRIQMIGVAHQRHRQRTIIGSTQLLQRPAELAVDR
jgi:hypothetical protein